VTGKFRAEVIPEESQDEWRTLTAADELVEFYDPTDVFGDLADALAGAFPSVAPELAATNGTGAAAGAGADSDEGEALVPADEGGDAEDEPTA
jgi:hypothetical protein